MSNNEPDFYRRQLPEDLVVLFVGSVSPVRMCFLSGVQPAYGSRYLCACARSLLSISRGATDKTCRVHVLFTANDVTEMAHCQGGESHFVAALGHDLQAHKSDKQDRHAVHHRGLE